MKFLEILFIIVGVFLLLKWTVRLLLPFLFKSLVKKANKEFSKQFNGGFEHSSQQQTKKETKNGVHIDYVPPKKGEKEQRGSHAGEFVDFEEVKEK